MPPQTTQLPEDFPGKKVLEANGVTTLEQVRAMTEADLVALDGIGPKTATEIVSARGNTAGAPAADGQAQTQTVALPAAPAAPAAAATGRLVEVPIKVGAERNERGTVAATIDPR
jgi:Helix-hairpin-helix domain